MDRSKFFSVAALAAFILVGCSESRPGVDESGNCDSNYVEANNAMAASAEPLVKYYNPDLTPNSIARQNPEEYKKALGDLVAKCDAFLASFGSISCRAIALKTGSKEMTDPVAIEKECSQFRSDLNETPSNLEQTSLTSDLAIQLITPVPTDKNVEVVTSEEMVEDNAP